MKQGTLYVGVAQRGRSPLVGQLVREDSTDSRGVYVLIARNTVLPVRAPALEVDPQDVQEALAVMLAAHPTIRQAAVEGFAQMADHADESVRGHSVATDTPVGGNHKRETASDLPVCRRWVAPPSGLELAPSPCQQVRLTVQPYASERERRCRRRLSCGPVRVGLGSSVANLVASSRSPPVTRVYLRSGTPEIGVGQTRSGQ